MSETMPKPGEVWIKDGKDVRKVGCCQLPYPGNYGTFVRFLDFSGCEKSVMLAEWLAWSADATRVYPPETPATSPWIDIEKQRPPLRERVIILIPFGMRVDDDTWTESGWLNTDCYVSHWQPINAPGTYQEIMTRPKCGEPLPVPNRDRQKHQDHDLAFSEAVQEHLAMMQSMTTTQFLLRLEATLQPPTIPATVVGQNESDGEQL